MPNYTINYCGNPAFQLGTSGYSAALNATLALDTSQILIAGSTASLSVTTPGSVPGEGVITANGLFPTSSVASVSVFIQGSGNLTVSAVINPGGMVVGSAPITANSNWQRVSINQLSVTPGQTLYLMVTTSTTQAVEFWIAGVQIEPASPSHPYCDGNQIGCYWFNGTSGPSYQPYQNPDEGSSNLISGSNQVPILQVGQTFPVTASSVTTVYDPWVAVTSPGPTAGLADFGIYELTDLDPALSYAGWNTAGTNTGAGGVYNRNWGIFYGPNGYTVSGNQQLYPPAAFMAVGWEIGTILNLGTVNLTDVQTEILPLTSPYGQPAPTLYELPRAIQTIIKPDRLNFVVNPSIEAGIQGWTAVATGALSQDGTKSVANLINVDEVLEPAGTNSLKVVVNANGDGAQISISNLIPGDTYIASAYVQPGAGLANITMAISGSSGSILSSGGTGYGADDFGISDPYGGIAFLTDLTTGVWYRINCIFVAASDTQSLIITANAAVDVAYPTNIWVDAVMVEVGETLGFYFDGNFGTNYYWESPLANALNQNADFELGTSPWTAGTGVTISESNQWAMSGQNSMLIQGNGTQQYNTVTSEFIAATNANTYNVSAWFMSPQGIPVVQMQFNYYNNSHVFLGQDLTSTIALPANTAVQLTGNTISIPGTTAFIQVTIVASNSGNTPLPPSVQLFTDTVVLANIAGLAVPNLARSYYYDQSQAKRGAVLNVLNKHLPLGISYVTPQYLVPYTQ